MCSVGGNPTEAKVGASRASSGRVRWQPILPILRALTLCAP
jgi:hypothetical protein